MPPLGVSMRETIDVHVDDVRDAGLITLAGVAILGALSYFNIMNVDLTAAQDKFKTSTSWVTEQGGRLKDVALAHVPGSAASFVGMFLGFRRR